MAIAYDTTESELRNIADSIISQVNTLTPTLENVLFVDGGRTEDYTEDGTITYPFKTITSANAVSVSGDVLIVAPGAYAETQTITTGTHLFGWNVTGATLTGEWCIFNGTTIDFSGNLVFENDEIIDNAVNGTIAITGAVDVSGALTVGGTITLESADTIANSVAGTIVLSDALTVGGDITMENAEVISNAVNGTIAITGAVTTTGTLDVAGDITLENDETISNATNGQVDIDAMLLLDMGTTGGYAIKFKEAVSAAMSGGSVTITLAVPSGAMLVGAQLRVDTLITSGDGATSWTAAYGTGATATIATGQAFTKNTKVNAFFDANAATAITSDLTDVVITPNSNTFSAGVVRAIVYYIDVEAMANAA